MGSIMTKLPLAKQIQGIFIELSGSDAQSFLQRLTSIDINALKKNQPTPASFLDSTAKPIAVFYIFQNETNLNLLVSQIYKEKVLSYLEKMHFSEDIQWHIQNIQWTEVRYTQDLSIHGYPLPDWKFQEKTIKGQLLFKEALNISHLNITIHANDFHIMECLAKNPGIDSDIFNHIMVLDGPFDYFISRNKGCYPGQEVVEKIYSIGRKPKKIICCQIEPPLLSVPETLIFQDKKIGKILLAYCKDHQVSIGLAVVRHSFEMTQMTTEQLKHKVTIL